MGRTLALLLLALGCCGPGAAACGGGSNSDRAPRSGTPPAPRGIRGERIGGEAAGSARLTRAGCAALARTVRVQTGRQVGVSSRPRPPLSRCRLSGRGVAVNTYLDTAHAAHQRYENRMVEQVQFGAPDPARLPHPVAGVGTPSAGEHEASWVPDLSTLFAVRGDRFLTVSYAVSGRPLPRRLAAAAAVAREAFLLSARRHG